MQIKRPRDLELRDLLRIESPTFAPSNLPLDTGIASPSLHRALDLADDFIGSPYRSDIERMDRLKGKLRDGSLVLVKGITDTPPFSPLIGWEEDGVLPGRWKVLKDVHGLNLASWVARMNDWQITPEQVKRLGPGSVGHLSADSFDSDLREQRAAERERVQRDSQKNLSLPVGAAAGVAPLGAAAADGTEQQPAKDELHIEVGIFTDGTGNNAENIEILKRKINEACIEPHQRGEISVDECEHRIGLMLGPSYANAKTNVHKLWTLYPEWDKATGSKRSVGFGIYVPGVGTTTGEDDSTVGMATGIGKTGIIRQVKQAFDDLTRLIRDRAGRSKISSLTIDIFGFSRGSATARHAISNIHQGPDGQLGKAFSSAGIGWPEKVSVRFAGLFDTVAGVANFMNGDFSTSDDQNDPVNVYLAPSSVESAIHITASDECRQNFALNSLYDASGSLPQNFREIAVPGVHSDVGGGYHGADDEIHLLRPVANLPGSNIRRPEETMVWDNLHSFEKEAIAEHWVGNYSLPLSTGEPASIEIDKEFHPNPSPDGRTYLKLKMKRYIRGELSRVNLSLMHELAVKAQVPFEPIPDREDLNIPEELTVISQELREKVIAGENKPLLSSDASNLLKQRYIHRSDHYDYYESLNGNTVVKTEIPFPTLNPFKPADNRIRIVHPNQPENME